MRRHYRQHGMFVKKFCGDKQCRRLGEGLELAEFPLNRTRPDERGTYCLECSRRRTTEYRTRKRIKRAAQQVYRPVAPVKRKPNTVTKVQAAIESGIDTRAALHEETQLDYDKLGDALASLVWELEAVRIERVGNARRFVMAA